MAKYDLKIPENSFKNQQETVIFYLFINYFSELKMFVFLCVLMKDNINQTGGICVVSIGEWVS